MTGQKIIYIIAWIAQERSEERVVGDWRLEREREREKQVIVIVTSYSAPNFCVFILFRNVAGVSICI